MNEIDDLLIAIAKRVSLWTIKTVGVSNYRIARIGLGLCMLEEISMIINRISQFLPKPTDLFGICLAPFLIGYITACYRACVRAENESGASRTMEGFLCIHQSMRIMWIVSVILFFPIEIYEFTIGNKMHFLQNYIYEVGQVIFTYFVSVGTLPPSVSRLRKFIESFQSAVTKVHA